MRTPSVYLRATRKLVALMVAVSLLTPLAAARGAAGCGVDSGNWTTIAAPRFPAGGQAITDLALDARTPSRFLVTNGTSVMRTTDGGCSWQHSYTLGDQGDGPLDYTASDSRIVSLVASEAGGRVLLSVAQTAANQTRPHVLVSPDAGATWTSGDTGLPPLGSPETVVVAPSSPNVVYLGIDLGGGTLDSLYASADGGRSWQPRSQQLGSTTAGFEVDPLVPTELWGYGDGLQHSTDGGATWVPVDEFVGTQTGPIDVFHAPGKKSSLFVFIPATRIVQRSDDGGANWLQSYGLPAPSSIDHGAIAESRIATSGGRAWVWAPALYRWIDARAPAGGLTDVSASRSASPSFYMRNATNILIYKGPSGGDFEFDVDDFDIGDISLIDPPEFLDPEPPELSPKQETIKIAAGDKKRVRYDLSLSKIRTPLDLYFLIDTSESAKPFLRGLAHVLGDLIVELYEARIDVRFGLAEYRAYPDSDVPRPECGNDDVPVVEDPSCERNFVYRQALDIPESTSGALAAAIEGLDPVAGGYYNAPLGALYQTATGAGQDLFPPGPLGHDIPKGQDASFRAKALKVVLNATDEEFISQPPYQNDRTPPEIPSLQETLGALNARDVRQIGLALGTAALGDLRAVSGGTGAVAPAEGADCDGDGGIDIGPGEPLVCVAYRGNLETGSNLVPAIVNMVEAVRTRTPVSLDVEGRDGIVASVTPDEYEGVVLQSDSALKFDVTYECPMAMAGKKSLVDLTASKGTDVLARATATVVCGKVDEDKKEGFFDIFPFDRVLGLLPLLPLSPPPTLANPSSATQAQSQAQAQGAMAAQEQQQPQVAYAIQHKANLAEALAKEEQQYQMTSYRDRSQPGPGLFLGAGALMMSAAYAVAMSRRRRAELALQRRR
jgi:hypothetical protein